MEQTESDVEQLSAQLSAATWDLEQTTVRAPSNGYVPNQGLQPGTRVNAGGAVMPFIDNSRLVIAMLVAQSSSRYIRVGQHAEINFEMFPGEIFPGQVKFIVPANQEGQVTPSGITVSLKTSSQPFIVELSLDRQIDHLPPGSVGLATIYTESLPITHAVRKVMIRGNSWLNYL